MNKRKKNNVQNAQIPHAPMRAMLSNKSVSAVKSALKKEDSHSFYYTIEDFWALSKMYGDILEVPDIETLNIKLHIEHSCGVDIKDVGAIFTNFIKERKLKTLGSVYHLIYKTKLSAVPLFINHPYLNLIAKWRLLINK